MNETSNEKKYINVNTLELPNNIQLSFVKKPWKN